MEIKSEIQFSAAELLCDIFSFFLFLFLFISQSCWWHYSKFFTKTVILWDRKFLNCLPQQESLYLKVHKSQLIYLAIPPVHQIL